MALRPGVHGVSWDAELCVELYACKETHTGLRTHSTWHAQHQPQPSLGRTCTGLCLALMLCGMFLPWTIAEPSKPPHSHIAQTSKSLGEVLVRAYGLQGLDAFNHSLR